MRMASRSTLTPARPAVLVWAAVADIVLVLVFVIIGRSSHSEALSVPGVLETLWPFVVGLAVGWLVTRAWHGPIGIVSPGLPIWALTVAVGMLFRAVTGQGIALPFVIVATVTLAIFLLGWRAAAVLVARRGRTR
jgi:hypothetical protein